MTASKKLTATGLSGQLQKAFVTGVPKLKRSELEAACEDFGNVIGTSPVGSIYTVYKRTLSSGVEIAVVSVTVTSLKDWSKTCEVQFRKKIDTLPKMNHENSVNLLGFCEEDEPFTRMVVFEYAPNGTLFEHLHVKEAEHLDWGTRLRVAIGTVYCLQHMHQLNPPLAHSSLNTSSVQLTDDYAAKISDLSFLKEIASLLLLDFKSIKPIGITQITVSDCRHCHYSKHNHNLQGTHQTITVNLEPSGYNLTALIFSIKGKLEDCFLHLTVMMFPM
ncbi:hypothetical protein KIW84_062610 [Lathyrus oleraceus]|uniref:Protein kinase domain-containing protein n=1 Tax=Pisum sativum TaxID=3888 RepID=A0A9D5A3S1_PEA|nr:hypothetical protein KIW84_062610 [Pisum sativum]